MKKPRHPSPCIVSSLPPTALPLVLGGTGAQSATMERYEQSAKNTIASMRG